MKTIYIVRWVARDGHASGEEQFTDADLAEVIAELRTRRGHTVAFIVEQQRWASLADWLVYSVAGMCGIVVLALLWFTR